MDKWTLVGKRFGLDSLEPEEEEREALELVLPSFLQN